MDLIAKLAQSGCSLVLLAILAIILGTAVLCLFVSIFGLPQ